MELINPLQEVFKTQGTVFYNDGRRRIDIKKPISTIFQILEQKEKQVFFEMELYLNKEKFRQRIEEIAEKGVLPVLVWFHKI